ncbi:hypothetical protein CCR82_02860 [Halochromatium salexigens]|uniref:DUF4168 domain-containing protein n=2 Tax=Halochromatium salexigens TaxID=49447 RepID=A0AAJ0UDL5_HALSE|nr:hypothetical protein [Halochromatium salexigens]
MTLNPLITALATVALLSATGAAFAQGGAGQPGAQQGAGAGAQGAGYQAPAPSAPLDVDDATVSEFADAFLSVQEISEDLTEKLSEAPSAEAAQTMQREAQDEMAKSVEDSGISVEQYNDIAVGMRQDPELAERVKTAVNEAR